MRKAIGAAACAAGALALAGCVVAGCTVEIRTDSGEDSLGSGPGVEERVEIRVEAADGKVLVVEGDAGSIDAGPGPEPGFVTVRALKRAPTEEGLSRIRVHAVTHGDEVRVGYSVEGDDDETSVSFTIEAPASLRARLRTGAGSIRVEGFQGGVEVHTGAGSVETTAVQGDQEIGTSAGSVRVNAADGRVRAETSAGSIRASGRLRGDCSLVTKAGSVEAHLPPDARLRVEGRTAAGSVRSDFSLSVEGKYAAKSLGGTLGDGSEGTLRLESSAGSISIRKE